MHDISKYKGIGLLFNPFFYIHLNFLRLKVQKYLTLACSIKNHE